MPYPITKTQFVDTQQIDAADFTLPFTETESALNALETAIGAVATDLTDLKNGTDVLQRLNLGPTVTLTLDTNGYIAATQSRHRVDTFSAAASDDLVRITGTITGGVIIIQSVSAARVVTIKHNVDNVFNTNLADAVLARPEQLWVGLYDLTLTKWVGGLLGEGGINLKEQNDPTVVNASTLSVPDNSIITTGYGAPRLDVAPAPHRRNTMIVRAQHNTTLLASMCSPVTLGTYTNASSNSAHQVNMKSATTLSSHGGFNIPMQIYPRWSPTIRLKFNAAGTNNVSTVVSTLFIGLLARLLVNATPSAIASNEAQIMIRAKNTAGSGGPVNLDIATGNASTASSTSLGVSYSVGSGYYEISLRLAYDGSSSGVIYGSVNDTAEVSHTTTMPSWGSPMYVHCFAINENGSVEAAFNFARLEVTYD